MQRELAHFRRLACLGLPPQAAVVALLDALHTLVPSTFNRFGFADQDFRITNGYCEDPVCYQFMAPYFSEFDGKMDYWPTVQSCLRRGPGVGYYLPYQTPQFYRTAYYNEIERLLGSYHQLDATIGDGNRIYGNVVLSRAKGHEFRSDELTLMAQLLPYFAHAMGGASETQEASASGTRSIAVVIVDAKGAVQSADAMGLRYLWMLAHDDLTATHITTKAMMHADAVAAIVARLNSIEEKCGPAPPSLFIRNGWGSFKLRAEPMYGQAGITAHIRVLIERLEASPLALCRRLHELQLTSRQRDVCELLNKGLTQAEIALQLGLRPSTINEYIQALYAKFNVHSRQALLLTLSTLSLD
jgi:DNA-binding NarL/FixJ family response regulator